MSRGSVCARRCSGLEVPRVAYGRLSSACLNGQMMVHGAVGDAEKLLLASERRGALSYHK